MKYALSIGMQNRHGHRALARTDEGSAMSAAARIAAMAHGRQMIPMAIHAAGQAPAPCHSKSHGNAAPVSSMPSPPPLKKITMARVPSTPASTPPQMKAPAPPNPAANRKTPSQKKS